MTNPTEPSGSEGTAAPVSVETALRSILRISQDRSLSEKRMRLQIWGFAKAAIEQIELGRQSGIDVISNPIEDLPVAWLHAWHGLPREITKTLADDRYGLAEAIPLTFFPNGEIIAWRWADGGGYNASHRYSFVDPLENPEEVEEQGAESVIGCRPLYVHPFAMGYKAGETNSISTKEKY